jgi:hypothetical protein
MVDVVQHDVDGAVGLAGEPGKFQYQLAAVIRPFLRLQDGSSTRRWGAEQEGSGSLLPFSFRPERLRSIN